MQKPLLPLAILVLVMILAPALGAGAQGDPEPTRVYLPLILGNPGKTPAFGFETTPRAFSNPKVPAAAAVLGATWVRMNFAVSWRAVQPTPTSPYNWSVLQRFEQTLRDLNELGLEPMVIVGEHPYWATVYPSSCAAIADEFHDEFAAFLAALVSRYKDQVSYWEIGNEPDVDPTLVRRDSGFGCWGDIRDPYYGGERFGRMLKQAAAAIRGADPNAKIIFGGLLLSAPVTRDPRFGTPERFLEGALRAGAGDSFDYLGYHAYPSYVDVFGPEFDYDRFPGSPWAERGGWSVGKAGYVREVLAQFGLSKPLMLNETGLICTQNAFTQCSPPSAAFFDAQANHVVRVATRAESVGVTNVIWYTLEGPGFRNSGLLDAEQSPRPVFEAFRTLIRLTQPYERLEPVFYGSMMEAYRYVRSPDSVDVIWSLEGTQTIGIPYQDLLDAYDRQGAPLPVRVVGEIAIFEVGRQPIYIVRRA